MFNKPFLLFLLYFLFVVYGSLVPLDYQPMPFDKALKKFENIAYLDLGIESRADWIANILLYIPLAFLALGSVGRLLKQGFWAKSFFTVLVGLICLATAVSVEFSQQFFPPRTVSLNDLIAETLGTVIGMVLWFGFGEKFLGYFRQISHGNWLSVKSGIVIFLPAYIFLSLFPFDFVTSTTELNEKLAGGQDTFWIDITDFQENSFRCIIKWLVEIAILIPLGAMIAALPYLPNRKSLAILAGFLLGFGIEITQVFIYSGSGQGFSILTRMLGMAIGVKAYDLCNKNSLDKLRPWLGWLIGIGLLPYIAVVVIINGGLDSDWLSIAEARQKLVSTEFLPFYYFYYTTETIALVSLLSNVGSYMPVGMFFWLYGLKNPARPKISGFWVGLVAGLFATAVETGKLFLKSKHVDPTDILIAFFAALGCYAALNKLHDIFNQSGQNPLSNRSHQSDRQREDIERQQPDSKVLCIQKKWLFPAGLIALLIVFEIIEYPLKPVFLGLAVFLYGLILLKQPWLGIFSIPALLPLLDFAPWSGRFFFDEFDLVILATLMLLWLKPLPASVKPPRGRLINKAVIGLFSLALLISLFIGLMPFSEPDENTFNNYYSNYNALRVVKGFFWAALLSPYLMIAVRDVPGRGFFSAGMLFGLTGVGLFTILERWVFPGLLDFSTDYRANALFSTMHNGGGHMESYLAMAMPFIALLFFAKKHRLLAGTLGVLLLLLSWYALLMTFSRGGFIGVFGAFVVYLGGLCVYLTRNRSQNLKWAMSLPAILLATVGFLSVPVLQGELMSQRLGLAEKDSAIRHNHWAATVDMMDSDIATQLFGMGLGSFPRTFFWSNQENAKPATYRIGVENDNLFLALQGGDALYMGQYIDVKPHQTLTLSLDVRSNRRQAGLSIPICEKSLQYSFRCVAIDVDAASANWRHVEKSIDSADVGSRVPEIAGGLLSRPVQLALYAGNDANTVIEIDNLILRDAAGNNLISNGDFAAAADRWYFSTEKHNPWHIFNIWVQVLFDMGWLGLCAFILLVLYVYYRLIKSLRHDKYAAVLLASFTGFLIIGYVDSPFDAPRLSLLFSMLVIFSIFGCQRPQQLLRV